MFALFDIFEGEDLKKTVFSLSFLFSFVTQIHFDSKDQ